MEEILIPMECLYDIPSLNEMSMPSYKKGDIFMFNPYHEIHVELDEHAVFKEIDNNLCDFFCKYPGLSINGNRYEIDEKIADEDIKSIDEESLRSLYYIGYIQKVVRKKKSDEKAVKKNAKTSKAKKTNVETYAMIASKLGYKSPDFKKACLDVLGIEIKDMRKKAPLKVKKEIIKKLSK